MQEAFLAACKKADKFIKCRNHIGWLKKAAENEALHILRKRNYTAALFLSIDELSAGQKPAAKVSNTMDELNKPDKNRYAYLLQLPIGGLLEPLDVAPVLVSCPEDKAYVDALEEAIIEREKEQPTGFFPDADQQREQFVAHYLPETDQVAPEPESAEHAVTPRPHRHVPKKHVIRLR